MAAFARYIGIDYSGAQTPRSSLPGLRVYLAEGDGPPFEVRPPPSPRKYWTRRGVVEWLAERLGEPTPTLFGIDHAFSFPPRYLRSIRSNPTGNHPSRRLYARRSRWNRQPREIEPRLGGARGMQKSTITITRLSKNVTGPYKYTIKMNMGAPLIKGVTPPELEKFTTREDADARAKELQEEAGGPDKAEIKVLDLTR